MWPDICSETEVASTHRRRADGSLSLGALAERPIAVHEQFVPEGLEWMVHKQEGGIAAWRETVVPPSEVEVPQSDGGGRAEELSGIEAELASAVQEMHAATRRVEELIARSNTKVATSRTSSLPLRSRDCLGSVSAEQPKQHSANLGSTSTQPSTFAPVSRPTSATEHFLSYGIPRARITYPETLHSSEKLARARMRELGLSEAVPAAADPRSTKAGQKAEGWKTYKAFNRRLGEIDHEISKLKDSDDVLVAVGAEPQEEEKIAGLCAEGGVLCGAQAWETLRAGAAAWFEKALGQGKLNQKR